MENVVKKIQKAAKKTKLAMINSRLKFEGRCSTKKKSRRLPANYFQNQSKKVHTKESPTNLNSSKINLASILPYVPYKKEINSNELLD